MIKDKVVNGVYIGVKNCKKIKEIETETESEWEQYYVRSVSDVRFDGETYGFKDGRNETEPRARQIYRIKTKP